MNRCASPIGEDGVGRGRICTPVVALIDTNILVYRFDPRDERKQRIATGLLRNGILNGEYRLAHQALLEFYSAVTRYISGYGQLLAPESARLETEELMAEFTVLYPDDRVLRTALQGHDEYPMSWFDAHMWAYAEVFRIPEIISEDFNHGQQYGSVRVTNPFREPR